MDLAGRDAARGALDALLARTQSGRGGAVVVRGEPGSGKSALVASVADRAAGAMTVVRVDGVESEVRIGFAALHRILLPFLGGLERLPDPQRGALAMAFGEVPATGPPPQMLVGLATLTLLTDAAHVAPVLCVVDDAHWLDAESLEVVTFVARRLLADSVAVVLTARSGERHDASVAGLATIELGPLGGDATRLLLSTRLGHDVPPEVASTLAAGTNGNALALVELAGMLEPSQLLGLAPLPSPLPIGHNAGAKYLDDVRGLPEPTRTALLVAACDPTGRLDLIDGAAKALGGSLGALEAAEIAGLVSITDRARFRHPLTRSAVYTAATAASRSVAHAALAEQLRGSAHDEQRLRHLAASSTSPDDDLADELERCADRVGDVGRWRDRTDLLVLSARFTTDPDQRGIRLLNAARASTIVGSFRRGTALVDEAVGILQDPGALAAGRWVQGLFDHERAHGEAPGRLHRAARELAVHIPEMARGALVDTITALTLAGDFGEVSRDDVLGALADFPPAPAEPGLEDVLLESQEAWLGGGFEVAVPHLRRVPDVWRSSALETDEVARFGVLALLSSRELLDPSLPRQIIEHSLGPIRQAGGHGSLPILLYVAVAEAIQEGRFGWADSLLAEAHDVNELLGRRLPPALLDVESWAWRGRDDLVAPALASLREEAAATGHGFVANTADAAEVALAIGRGRSSEAVGPAARLAASPFVGWTTRALPDLVEAAVRSGAPDVAADAAQRLRARAEVLGTPLAMGLSARGQALVTDDATAERYHLASIGHLSAVPAVLDRARSQLLYGEWLRRSRRPADSRSPLRSAFETFDGVGAAAFAGRARDELLATGETVRRRDVRSSRELTPRESQVARLAAEGQTNVEIAAALYISAATVEYHLSKTYRKLDITSRRQLGRALPR